jgi:hypothetical protein
MRRSTVLHCEDTTTYSDKKVQEQIRFQDILTNAHHRIANQSVSTTFLFSSFSLLQTFLAAHLLQ